MNESRKAGRNESRSIGLRLDPQRRGYMLEGILREGFADDPDLEPRQRLMIARWANHFEPSKLSDTQVELLGRDPLPRVSDDQRELLENQRELRTSYLAALFASLDRREQRFVQTPELAGAGGYPLSVGGLSTLTGASERQIRKWADDGLLPSFREGPDRRFYSAAAIRAFALVLAPQYSKTVAAAAAKGEVGHHLQLLAATLGRAAAQMPADLRVRITELAEDLSSSSRLMTDVSDGDELRALWHEAKAGSSPRTSLASHPREVGKVRRGATEAVRKSALGVIETDDILSARYGGGDRVGAFGLVLTVPRVSGGWVNEIPGHKGAESIHRTKQEALERGRELARKKHARHVVYSRDGVIADTRDYGK